jgi:DNA-binding protein HU-beta
MSVLREESAVSRAPGLDQLMVAAKRRYAARAFVEKSLGRLERENNPRFLLASPKNSLLRSRMGIIIGRDSNSSSRRKRMTQSQLVKHLAEECEVSNKLAKQMLETLAGTAIKEVKKTGMFVVPGLGKLVRVDRKARMGRNPATGEAISIPAKKVVKFRVAKAVKDAIVPAKGKKATAS